MLRLLVPVLLTASLFSTQVFADPPEAKRKPEQIVLISFDGAHDLEQWRRSRALAQKAGARFTYFLSCVFLLSRETKAVYQPPQMRAGRSNVGFAQTRAEVEQRLDQIRLAVSEGNELASHACGHFDGANWTADEWTQEFTSFSTILRDAYTINGIAPEPDDWQKIASSITGVRAPYLSTGPALFKAIGSAGLSYDASGVSRGPALPDLNGTLARFALPQIKEGPRGRPVIAMDYNLYVRHSGGKEAPARSAEFEERTYAAFKAAFDDEYRGARIPLQLGFHFVLMNDGAYWRALERFAEEVCGKPDVACITYRDYLARAGFKLKRTPDSQG